jgi:hypothetical protein
MLLHRGAWNDDRYLLMKTDAMSRDPRRQKYEWLKRDIMQQRCWQKYLSDMTVAKKFEYPTIHVSPIADWLLFIPGDYSIGEGNTLYDLRKIFVRGFSYFSLWSIQ